jgi:purine nucleoside permease
MKFMRCVVAFATLAFFVVSLRAYDRVPVKVVVVTTFQAGSDTDPTAGEFGNWVLNLPLPLIIPFPQGYHPLRYNPDLQVLGIVTGEGKSHAAASIMGLGMDPRFDLSKAYWIIAAIAGVDPKKASVASAAWAKFVVDGDLLLPDRCPRNPAELVYRLCPPRSLEPLSTTLSTIQFQWCSTGLLAQCLPGRLGFPVDSKHLIAR